MTEKVNQAARLAAGRGETNVELNVNNTKSEQDHLIALQAAEEMVQEINTLPGMWASASGGSYKKPRGSTFGTRIPTTYVHDGWVVNVFVSWKDRI